MQDEEKYNPPKTKMTDDDGFDDMVDLGPDEYFAIAVGVLCVIGLLIWAYNMAYS